MTFLVYYLVARTPNVQIGVLVTASAVFYSWHNPPLIFLLIATATLAATVSFLISRDISRFHKSIILWSEIGIALGALAYFKYGGLLFSTLVGVGNLPDWEQFFLNVPLPVGISFYIFHTISLIVDVWRKDYLLNDSGTPTKHLLRTFLYITFFPQLIAGPIVKAEISFPKLLRSRYVKSIGKARFNSLPWDIFSRWSLRITLPYKRKRWLILTLNTIRARVFWRS